MKILIAHDVKPARTGGMSRIMGFLHDEVAAHGHQVEYFCTDDAPPPVLHQGLRRFTFPLAVRNHARASARLGQPFDIINVHEPSGSVVAAVRHGLGCAKVVVTSHGVERRGWNLRLAATADPADRPVAKTKLLYPATVLWQSDLALKKADHVFCLNSDDREYIMSGLGKKPSAVTRIFPAADPVFGANATKRNYSKATTLLFAGTWLVRKGIRDLASAFANIARTRPEVRLTILNPGVPSSKVLSDFPEDCRSKIDCAVAQPEAGTAAVMEESDIFVLPSRFEGTPLTLMEGMWSGLPVVSTAVCGMKDVIRDGHNGLLVEPGNPAGLKHALERLLDDSELRKELGRNAHLEAKQRYKWSDSGTVVLQAYEALINRAKSS